MHSSTYSAQQLIKGVTTIKKNFKKKKQKCIEIHDWGETRVSLNRSGEKSHIGLGSSYSLEHDSKRRNLRLRFSRVSRIPKRK